MKNLFSYLTKEQFDSLSDEERRSLARIDEKLFPDDPHSTAAADLYQDWLKRTEAQEADRKQYKEQLEQSFAR